MVIGIIFLIMGIVLILHAFGWFAWNIWTLFWGALFLAVGIKLISRRHHRCLHCAVMGHHAHCQHGDCVKDDQAKDGGSEQ